MTRYARTESLLVEALNLHRRPVAIAFRDQAPPDVPRFEGTVPSSCSFWPLAATRPPFYTVQSDHYNCPVGSYTHNIPLPTERAGELNQVLGLMTQIGYLKMEEVPGIPRLERSPAVVIYAALGETPVTPDVVLFSGRPSQLMLLQEAALRAGLGATAPLLGRPTCMALPAAMAHGVAASLGCVGNRVYTDVPDDEFYVAVAGSDLETIVEQLSTVAAANRTLHEYHRERRTTLTQ